jgi:hypothetical protein
MDIPRRVVLGLLVTVASATTLYGVFFNGKFSEGGTFPMWLLLVSLVTAAVAVGIMLWWLNRVGSGKVPARNVRDYEGFYVMMPVAGILSEALTIAVEIIVGAPSLWMIVPISALTYCLGVVWIYRRYYRHLAR